MTRQRRPKMPTAASSEGTLQSVSSEAVKRIQDLLVSTPYIRYLGMQIDSRQAPGALLFRLPFDGRWIGSARLNALHGGVVAGFMSAAARLQLQSDQLQAPVARLTSVSVNYLQLAIAADCFARARILRRSPRSAVVSAVCWQSDENKLVAVARMRFVTGQARP